MHVQGLSSFVPERGCLSTFAFRRQPELGPSKQTSQNAEMFDDARIRVSQQRHRSEHAGTGQYEAALLCPGCTSFGEAVLYLDNR